MENASEQQQRVGIQRLHAVKAEKCRIVCGRVGGYVPIRDAGRVAPLMRPRERPIAASGRVTECLLAPTVKERGVDDRVETGLWPFEAVKGLAKNAGQADKHCETIQHARA